MKHRQFVRPLIAGLSMALVSGAALAYGSGSSSHSGNMGNRSDCMSQSIHQDSSKGQRGGVMQLSPAVIEKLNLTETQKVALFDAQTTMQAMRQNMRQSMRQARGDRDAALGAGEFDPREIFERQDERFSQMSQARAGVQQQWLTFWDTLDATQKSVIEDYLRSKGKGQAMRRG